MADKTYEATYNAIVEHIVDSVWKKCPDNLEARLYLYDRIADSFAAMARVLRSSKNDKSIVETIRTEEPDEESDTEEETS